MNSSNKFTIAVGFDFAQPTERTSQGKSLDTSRLALISARMKSGGNDHAIALLLSTVMTAIFKE
ncbi:hypothetical protein HW132_30790 [Brasilonema sp. CT11]|nr:hypothetical protein [Brasilonema sp. CT11]